MDATDKAKRERKTWTTVLIDGGDGRLEARIEKRKDGTWKSRVVHVVGKGKGAKRAKGATKTHPDEAAARAAQSAAIAAGLKAGWKERPARAGFESKPDAFDLSTLPRPGKAKAK
jgi:hypothetical protein